MELISPKLSYERLSADHLFGSFTCGNADIDRYLFNEAYADQCRGISSTTIVKKNEVIVGFYSTNCTQIEIRESEKIEHGIYYDRYWPAIEVRYLAVDINSQRKGIGEEIVKRITIQTVQATKWLAAKYLFLWSVPNSVNFYERLGFLQTKILGGSESFPMRFPVPQYEKLFEK